MKKLLTILFLLHTMTALAQSFNNEWIDYSKTYYKFKVGSNGLYRIPQSALVAINQANTDVSAFQLWRNGVEVPIYTSGQTGALAAGGFIEFWGEVNDGKADQVLYRNPLDQINNSKSLFTDTAAYFLTVNAAGSNKRLIPTANTIPAGAVAEPYFMHTAGIYLNESIHLGPYEGAVSTPAISASFEGGEGWTSNEINQNQTRTIPQSGLFPFTGSGAPPMQLNMRVVGNSDNSRVVQMKLNNNEVFNTTLNQFNYSRLSGTLPVTALTGASESIQVSNISAVANNRIKIGAIEIVYPRIFNFGGSGNFRFKLPGATATGKYMEIAGFNTSGAPVLYDLSSGKRYDADASNPSLVKIYVLPSIANAEVVLVNTATVKTINNFETRSFIDYSAPANQGNYLMITHQAILNGSGGSQPVEEYRAYRSSQAGGGYNAKIYLIDQLTDQFAYGIKGSPLSVRNFLRFARSHFSTAPKSVFIVGKGVKYTAARYNESNPVTGRLNLIPTFGEPASDKLLAAEGASSIPLTPIGRVPVVNGNEFAIYLEKVKQYEEKLLPQPNPLANSWKKNIAHIVGSDVPGEISQLYAALNFAKNIATDTLYGANVIDFLKSTNAGEQQKAAEAFRSLMNSGVNLVSYFGHSSTEGLVFKLDDPTGYLNQGKYPVFHMMGCNVGDIFILNEARLSNITTFSEKFMFEKERGSIAMMAGTALGFIQSLALYNQELYAELSKTSYGGTLGEMMQKAIVKTFAKQGGEGNRYVRAQCEQYTLNGDPAIRFYQYDKPDYAIEDQMVTVNPSIVSVADPSFIIKAKIANLGKAVNRNVIVELKRTLPDLSTKIIQRDTLPPIRYADSILYQIHIDPLIDKGANQFTITIDPENATSELFETNNTLIKDIFIYEDDIKPVFPANYSIINRQNIVLSASTGNPFAESRNYVIEIDTVRTFNSSFKISQNKISSGGLLEFSPGFTFKDSTVYYWRVAYKSSNANEQPIWNGASFTYMQGTNYGYSQSGYGQLIDNAYSEMGIKSDGSFVYDSLTASLIVTNAITRSPGLLNDVAYQINGLGIQGGYIMNPANGSANPQENSLRFYLINNRSLAPVENADLGASGMYGSYRPLPIAGTHPRLVKYFQFDISTTNARKTVMSFLDSIPNGYYVALTSNQIGSTILPAAWQADTSVLGRNISLYHQLKSIGLSELDLVNSVVPYIFIYQKGKPGPLAQAVGTTVSDKLSVSITVPAYGTTGTVKSPVYPKAKEWKTLVWDGYSVETPSTDNAFLAVLGVDATGRETELIGQVPVSQKRLDLSSLNVQNYAGLRIALQTRDTIDKSPYQLKYWRLYNVPAPEGGIAPNIYFSTKDTVEAGEPLNLGIAFKNVSDHSFDSLALKLSIRDQNNVEHLINVPKIKPLAPGDTVRVNVSVDTRSFGGTNLAYLEVNPEGGHHQLEQYLFNNFVSRNFHVRRDTTNPYLDVTFDGARILNRDIISSKPTIVMKLTDDSKYLLLNNTDLVKVQLKHPDGATRDYKFNNDTLVLTTPGQGGNNANTATVTFKPHLLADGDYELMVSAKDQSGNTAGNLDYRIAFQVINKPMISNLLNYPNPFTSSTAFVFTLTGSDIPQNIRIQILTVTGKIVREITKAELGPLRIGRNITEFKWDGTDQYGQKLGNGVYLYRVLTNLNGRSLDKYSTKDNNTDKYFNKGYGKMVLIR
ncbi:C25 family cysteine peptidase [Niabella yanshanensis]|uniref:C25 family cysteine peptidase n=1 Tax=Niabella yanshanensis TaxID=577386 RepID=A0ABZ0WCH5_9BACT|nr:C25 family cysteine peptidase [Niabella yanshanensis]WQD40439.1 C25 family cysteine peptidase [Niabella yanshanensis]